MLPSTPPVLTRNHLLLQQCFIENRQRDSIKEEKEGGGVRGSTNNMEENNTGKDQDCLYLLGKCHRTSPRQGDLESGERKRLPFQKDSAARCFRIGTS